MTRFFIAFGILLVAMVPISHATIWHVTVSNFQFSPSDLVILQGDTVVWTNTNGNHSVQQTCSPTFFGNNPAPSPWVYTFVFNIPLGRYPYICGVHGSIMPGSITVQRRGIWSVIVRDFSFTPANLTITQGDTVVWSNVLGTHSVHELNGVFGNNIASAPWVYTFVFNVAAVNYNYECQRHPDFMQGTINILAPQPQPNPSRLTVSSDGTDAYLQWSGPCYAVFNVYKSTDPENWSGATMLAQTNDTSYVDFGPPDPQAFYRVVAKY
jgi:plastocyanin